jgi:Zn-dependent protease
MLTNPLGWSLPLGRLFGISVRVHLLFLLVAPGLILNHALKKNPEPVPGAWIDMTIVMGLLFVSVLAHEFGHCFAARRVDGDASEVLLWPLGGLAMVEVPQTPRANLITAAGGPLVNLVFCVASLLVLTLAFQWWPPLNPFFAPVRAAGEGTFGLLPLSPAGPEPFGAGSVTLPNGIIVNGATSPVVLLLAWFFWVNWFLTLLNVVLVGFPLDGGRILQAILWRYVGYRQATLTAVFIGFVTACVVGLFSIIMDSTLALALALFIGICCRQEYILLETGGEEGVFGYDFSQGYTSLERDQPAAASGAPTPTPRRKQSWWQRWRQSRAARRMQREQEVREAEERRMDELLEKVQREGISALTEEEKRFLKRVSDRYRNRQ